MMTVGKIRVSIATALLLSVIHQCEADSVSKGQEAQLQAIAYSATLAKFVSTNSQAFAAALAPASRARWQKEEPSLRVKGVQLFLPDFFKVAYVYNGSVEGDRFCFGLYNPFYDHMLLCKASNLKKTEIVDYKWVSGAALRGNVSPLKRPLALGVDPADEYFPALLKVLADVLAAFNGKCLGTAPDLAFAGLPSLDATGIENMLDIAVFRTAQAVKMTGDKSSYGLSVLATLVLHDEKIASQPFLSSDDMTKAMVKALSSMSADMRKAFKVIGYFEADGERCVLFYNSMLPRFLALVGSRGGRNVRLWMCDANGASDFVKRVSVK